MELSAVAPDLRLWARVEWRSRWRSYVVLVLVVTMVVAVVLAAFTAAARTDTAYTRLNAATHAGEGSFFFDAASPEVLEQIKSLPEVERAAFDAQLFVRPKGSEYYPDYTLLVRAPMAIQGADPMNQPIIVAGRAVDPAAAAEVVLSESLADALGVGVGSTLTVESMTEEWRDVAYDGGDPGPPDGPEIDLRVVGIGTSTADFGRWVGIMHLGPGFVRTYGGQMETSSWLEADLTDEALAAALAGNPPPIDVEDASFSHFFDESASAGALDSIATALRLVAVAAAIAGAAAIAVLIARIIAGSLRHRTTLATLGWTARRQGRAIAVTLLPPLAVAVVLGLVVGLVASPHALIGLAGRVDPSANDILLARWWLLGVAAVAMVAGIGGALLAIRIALRRRPSHAVRSARVLQLHSPLPVWLGIRHALFGRAERGGRISRSAALAGAMAATAAVGALVVSSSIGLLERDPGLSGQGVGRAIDSGEATDVQDAAMARLEDDERIELLASYDISFAVAIDDNDMSALIYDVRRGRFEPALIAGRVALQADEVMLGPRTLERFGIELGDLVEITIDRAEEGAEVGDGAPTRATVEVVGVTLFPEGDFEFDDGIALPRVAADRVLGDSHAASEIHGVIYDWAPEVDAESADAGLLAEGLPVQQQVSAAVPGVVRNLGEVGSLPRWFAVFVGILACVSIAHATAVALRLRRRELNTLRALGMTGRSNASVLGVHVLTIAGVGIAIGVPLGLAVGAQVWRSIAESSHVVVQVEWPWTSVVQLLVLTAGFVILVSGVAALRAMRLRPAEDLRTG